MINIMAIAKTIIILSSSYGYVSFDGFNGQVQLTTWVQIHTLVLFRSF